MKRINKRGKVTNKSTEWIAGYIAANKMTSEDNERRKKEQGVKEEKGLKNLRYNEKIYIAVIVLGLIGCVIKYIIL